MNHREVLNESSEGGVVKDDSTLENSALDNRGLCDARRETKAALVDERHLAKVVTLFQCRGELCNVELWVVDEDLDAPFEEDEHDIATHPLLYDFATCVEANNMHGLAQLITLDLRETLKKRNRIDRLIQHELRTVVPDLCEGREEALEVSFRQAERVTRPDCLDVDCDWDVSQETDFAERDGRLKERERESERERERERARESERERVRERERERERRGTW